MDAEIFEHLVERLELKLAFLERANQDLSDVVYRQQQELIALQARIQVFAGRIEELSQPQRAYTQEEERPPHY